MKDLGNQKALSAEQSQGSRTECSAHTPGPWYYRENDALIIAPDKRNPKNNWHIAYLRPQGVETPANARLIAAAPDMLAALRICENYLALSLGSPGYEGPNPYETIKTALALALALGTEHSVCGLSADAGQELSGEPNPSSPGAAS